MDPSAERGAGDTSGRRGKQVSGIDIEGAGRPHAPHYGMRARHIQRTRHRAGSASVPDGRRNVMQSPRLHGAATRRSSVPGPAYQQIGSARGLIHPSRSPRPRTLQGLSIPSLHQQLSISLAQHRQPRRLGPTECLESVDHFGDKVVLIGHSLGSVIAIDLLDHLPENVHVRRSITIGSPAAGTVAPRSSERLLRSSPRSSDDGHRRINRADQRATHAFRRSTT